MKHYVCALLLLTLAMRTVAAASPDVFQHSTDGKTLLTTILAEPSKYLADSQVLQGRFIHSKHLSEIPQPLTATGEFTFARNLGVYWHTQQPFDSVFVLTQQGIVQRDEGAETLRLSADEQPAVRVIANIFLALFTLDVATLSASFDLYGQAPSAGPNSRWIVGLKPRSGAVASVFQQALISGGKDVEQVVLTDKHGDRTVIDLQNIVHRSDAPDSRTRALFKR